MYAVIFKAKIKQFDKEYLKMAKRMRELATKDYGCIDFISVCEKNLEISISYWENKEQIKKWKNNSEHIIAQELGKSKWYDSYEIEIAKIERKYNGLEK